MKLAGLLGAALFAVATLSGCATQQNEPTEKVVYHINDASVARVAMNNIRNHLQAEPGAKIVVVGDAPAKDAPPGTPEAPNDLGEWCHTLP